MATKSIAWNTGGGNITVDYGGEGNGPITITTNNNALHSDRSLVIVVLTTDGLISKDLTVMQVAKPYINLSTAIVSADALTYNGGALTPTVTVLLDGDVVPSTLYDVEYSNNTNAGTATITITGKVDYTGTATGTFVINKANPVYTAPTTTSPVYNGTGLNLLNAGSTAHGTIQYSNNGTSWSTNIPQGTNASDYTSYWRLVGDVNHNGVSSTSITTTISKVTPTVVAPTPYTLTYNGSSLALVTAGSTNWGTLKYSLDNFTWSTSVPTAVNYGTYTVYYKVDGDSNINSVASVSILASIAEKRVTTPTITLDTTTYTYSGNQCTPTPTVKDGTTIIDPSEYTVSYSNNVNAGTATVTISDNVGGNYYIVGSTTFTINKVTPIVTAPTAKTLTYTGNSLVLANAGSTNWGTLQYSADNSTWSAIIPSGTNAGTDYKVYYRVVGDSNINDVASTYITCAIGKAAPTYTAPTAKTLTYNGSALSLLNTGSTSHGTIQYSSDNSTWSTSIPTGTNATSYNTYWRLVGDSNHSDIGSTKIVVSISKVTPSITAPTAKSLTYTGSAQALVNAGSVDFGTLQYSLNNSTWGTSIPTGTTATSYTVYYRVVGDSNINDVTSQSVACSIGKASLSASVSMNGWTYGGTASNPSVSGNSGSGSVTYNYKVNGASDSTYTATKPSNVGTYVVRAQIAETTNYYGATVTNTFTIAKAAGSISYATTSVSKTYGNSAFTNTLTKSGDGSVTYASSDTSVATVNSSGQVTIVKAGSATITATVTDGTNYSYATKTASYSLSVAKAAGSVTTAPVNNNYVYNGNSRNVASAGSGTGTMYYKLGDGSWSTSMPKMTSAGSNTLYYYAAESTNYTQSDTGSITVTVQKASLSAPSVSGATTTYHNTATATASGGGGVGTLIWTNGNTRTAVGTTTTAAYWSGNSNYNASPNSNSVNLVVNKATDQSITVSLINRTYNTSSQVVATATSVHGITYYYLGFGASSTSAPTSWGSANSSISQTNAGTYYVWYKGTADGNHSADISATYKGTVTIGKADQAAPSATGATTTYPTTATASASGGGGVGSIEWSNGNTQTSVGSKTTYARWTGNSNYNASAWSNGVTLAMNKAAGSVSISGVSSSYSGSSQSLASVSGATGTMHYSTDYSNWSTSIPASTNAGSWTIYWYMDASTNYEGISASTSRYVSSSIAKINPTITAAPTNANPTYNGSAQYLLTGGTANVGGNFSYSTGTNAGSYTATWWFTPNDTTNYNSLSGYVDATIAKASRTISFTDSYVVLVPSGNTTKTATPSAGSGDGAITYSISSTTYATINSSSGKVTAKTSDGSAIVTATIAEGTNYLSATASYNLYVFATTHNYDYNGSYRSVTLPPGTYQLQVWGAQGGSNGTNSSYGITAQTGGEGGYSVGKLTVSQTTDVRVYVGGQGSSSAGGFNGGGSTSGTSQYNSGNEFGYSKMGGGGGATDIRLSDGALLSRMIVAGGGGGGAMSYKAVTTEETVTTWPIIKSQSTSGNTRWQSDGGYYVSIATELKAGKSYIITFSGTTPNKINFDGNIGLVNWVNTSESNPWNISYDCWVYLWWSDGYHDGTFTIKEKTTTTETVVTENTYSGVGMLGGGVKGGGINAGIEKSAGPGGSFGQGANQTVTNYRFASGAGGGGWYGGGCAYSDSDMAYVEPNGGGSGFVNTAASAGNRPSGYIGLQLDSGETILGYNTSFPAPGGGNEFGHIGNGYARITRL